MNCYLCKKLLYNNFTTYNSNMYCKNCINYININKTYKKKKCNLCNILLNNNIDWYISNNNTYCSKICRQLKDKKNYL